MRLDAGAVIFALLVALAGCGPSPTPATGGAPSPAPASDPQPVVTLTVPRLGLADVVMVPLGLNPDRTLAVPPVNRPEQVGWYAQGPTPGQDGPAVILGHVNGDGRPGAFARLNALQVGDRITTSLGASPTTFRVTRVQRVPKTAFPTSAVYSDTAGPELRLITCGGAFLGEDYADNVIVYASRE